MSTGDLTRTQLKRQQKTLQQRIVSMQAALATATPEEKTAIESALEALRRQKVDVPGRPRPPRK